MSFLSQFEASPSPRALLLPSSKATPMASTNKGHTRETDSLTSLELDPSTVEAIGTETPVRGESVKFAAYLSNRRTASPEITYRPASNHDSSLDPMPARMKSKTKYIWRSVKKSVARGWKKVFGKNGE